MKKEWTYVLAGMLFLFGAAGCAGSNNAAQPNHAPDQTQQAQLQRSYNSLAHGHSAYTKNVNENNYRKGFTVNGYNQHMAELLGRGANEVPGVVRASVIVKGSDAVVGIVVRNNLQGQQLEVVRSQVRSTTRAIAPNMNIYVTSDPQMFQQLRAMNAAIYQQATMREQNVPIGPNAPYGSIDHHFTSMLHQLSEGRSPQAR
ncbi:YhcN/YlaJ family sporulation lipoprotein [Brevibacillus sp. TJ4]|uniref:YhcN/YlaJ family sporulation lipoprotein n=1 Tax=Brevibacillus sp. TJ4 TaxID=3234853 RepID=UPI0037CDA621